MAKLTSARIALQSLNTAALEGIGDALEEERSDVNLSLRNFDLGSTLQTTIEALVVNTNEIEEEEDKISSEIAGETRRLEKLELKVTPSSVTRYLPLISNQRFRQ